MRSVNSTQKIPVETFSPRVQVNRKLVDPTRYLEDYAIHPAGHSLALNVPRQIVYYAVSENHDNGAHDGVRYRLTRWLNDGKRVVTISDEGGEEALEIHTLDNSSPDPI